MSYGMQQAPQYGGGNGYGYPPPNNANQGGQAHGYYNEASGPGGYGKQQQYGSGPMPLAPEGYQGQRFAPAKPKIRDVSVLSCWLQTALYANKADHLSIFYSPSFSSSSSQSLVASSASASMCFATTPSAT